MNSVRILIADDHEVVRQGLRAILQRQPGWEICGEASTGRMAVEEAARLKPDVVVMDISMPGLNGLDATRQILKALPQTQILILSLHDSETLVHEVLASGARGYVLKSDASRELIAAVDSLAQRRPFLTSKISEMVLEGYLRGAAPGAAPPGPHITPREREIVQLLAEGHSNKEVASLLKISIKTVETHRSNIMGKLKLNSLSDLVRYAIRNGIIES